MTQQPGYQQYGDPDHGNRQFGDQQYGGSAHGDHPFGNQPATVGPDDRTLAALAHASSLIAMVLSAGWLSFVGPLVMWLIYRDRSPFVRQAAAGSFNFNLGLWILSIVGWMFIITVIGIPIGLVLLAVSIIAQVVGHIIGTLRATQGRTINYPFQLRVLH